MTPPRPCMGGHHHHRNSAAQFMQDRASVHKAQGTTTWLRNKGIRMFNGGIWPPNSPDMNPIEHVWPMVSRQLIGQVFPDRDALWAALETAFRNVTPEQIMRLYASMPNRLDTLCKARGGHIRY